MDTETQTAQPFPVLSRPVSGLLYLSKIKSLWTVEQWASDPRLLLFGVRCARRLLTAAKEQVPVAEITVEAINALERYAEGKTTVDEAVNAGKAAWVYHVGPEFANIDRLVEGSIAAVAVPVCRAGVAGACAMEVVRDVPGLHGLLAASALSRGVHQQARDQATWTANCAEWSHQHADILDLFCAPTNDTGSVTP